MKNLFKKLALVLALAFTISVAAPAASASAAAAPSYKKNGKILYVGGDVSGTIPATYRFYFNNAAGYTATWKTSDSKIAKIDAKSGVITAVAPGKATITATLTNKAGKKCVLTNTVWVKQNADKVEFGSMAKIENGLKVGEKAKINVARMLGNTKVWSQSDFSLVTDYVVWTTSDASVATVDKWGTVTAKKAGEVTITASATQSNGELVSAKNSYKLVVTDGLVSATQKDLDTIDLQFAGTITKDTVNTNTIKLFKMVGSTKVAMSVKAVTVDTKDATKATLDAFSNFEKNATYVVEFDGKSFEIKAAAATVEAVTDIVINTTEVVGGKAEVIDVDVVDANGVVITTEELLNRVTIESKNTNIWLNGKEVTFFANNQEAVFTAVFHTYSYDSNGVEKTIKKDFVIKSVEEKATNVSRVDWTLTDTTSTNFDFTENAKEINKVLTLSESNGVKLVVQYQKDDKNKTKITTESDSESTYTFESSNDSVVIANGHNLYPVKSGSATILIRKNDVVIDSIQITVNPKRVATELVITPSKNVISSTIVADTIEVKFEVKDQYNTKFSDSEENIKVETLATPTDAAEAIKDYEETLATTLTANALKVTFNGSQFNVKGTYQFRVSVGDITRVFNIVANEVDSSTDSYLNKLVVDKTVIDTTVKLNLKAGQSNTGYKAPIKINTVDKKGNYVGTLTDVKLNKDNALASITNTGSAYYVEVVDSKGNKVTSTGSLTVGTTTISDVVTVSGDAISFNAITETDNVITKVPAGQYKVTAYKVTVNDAADDTKNVVQALGQQFITVTDSTPSYTVVQKAELVDASANINSVFAADLIEVKLDWTGTSSTELINASNIVDSKVVGNISNAGNTAFIQTITVQFDVTIDGEAGKKMLVDFTINKDVTAK